MQDWIKCDREKCVKRRRGINGKYICTFQHLSWVCLARRSEKLGCVCCWLLTIVCAAATATTISSIAGNFCQQQVHVCCKVKVWHLNFWVVHLKLINEWEWEWECTHTCTYALTYIKAYGHAGKMMLKGRNCCFCWNFRLSDSLIYWEYVRTYVCVYKSNNISEILFLQKTNVSHFEE